MEPYTRVKSLGFLIDTALMMSQMLPERKRKIAELAKGLVLSAMPGVGSASLHVAGNGASLLLACPALKMFLAPVWDAFPKVDMETGMVPMTQVLHEALGEFTLEQIDRWCLIARWRPEAHVTLSMAELVLGSVETGIRDTIFSDASGGSKRSDASGWGGVIYFPDGTRREFSGAFDVHEQGFIHCKEAIAALRMLERSGLRDCYVVLCVDNMAVYHGLKSYYSRNLEFRIPYEGVWCGSAKITSRWTLDTSRQP